MRYSSRNRLGEEIYANAFERQERTFLDQLIAPGLTVLDVGANLGFYTCLFASKVGPSGRVIAFEPTPSTFQALEQNVRINGFGDVVACRCCALSNTEGVAPMNTFPEGGDVYNSFGATCALDGGRPQSVIQVPTTTLDAALESEDLRNGCFLKIDVEGFEHQVLLGGQRRLRREPKLALMVELYEPAARQCGSSTLATLDLLEGCGFEAYRMTAAIGLARLQASDRIELAEGRLPPDVFFFKNATRPSWLAGRN